MEKKGLVSSSVHVCSSVLEDTILRQAGERFPPSRAELSAYSCKESERLSNAIFRVSKHYYDKPSVRLSEDTSEVRLKKRKFSRGEVVMKK